MTETFFKFRCSDTDPVADGAGGVVYPDGTSAGTPNDNLHRHDPPVFK